MPLPIVIQSSQEGGCGQRKSDNGLLRAPHVYSPSGRAITDQTAPFACVCAFQSPQSLYRRSVLAFTSLAGEVLLDWSPCSHSQTLLYP